MKSTGFYLFREVSAWTKITTTLKRLAFSAEFPEKLIEKIQGFKVILISVQALKKRKLFSNNKT